MTKKSFYFAIIAVIILTGFISFVVFKSGRLAHIEKIIRGDQSDKIVRTNNSELDSFTDYYNTAQQNSDTSSKTNISFFAVGDIMLSRDVAAQINKRGKDSYWPFRALENELLSTDFNFGNLESPFSGNDKYYFDNQFIFNSPTWAMPGLAQHNFKVLSLANNHILNQGIEGLDYTTKLLEENGSLAVGTGRDQNESWQGKVYSVKGVRVGFIAATYGVSEPEDYNRVAFLKDEDKLIESIKDLKLRSDFIIVSMHAGTEYTREPNWQQTKFAHTAIDNGADIVIGSHPHWIQTIEKYKNKYIFYSLGNFVFDQMWSLDTREGLMLKIFLEKPGTCSTDPRLSPTGQQGVVCSDSIQGTSLTTKLQRIELVPVIIENYGQPRLANQEESKIILKKIGITSKAVTP